MKETIEILAGIVAVILYLRHMNLHTLLLRTSVVMLRLKWRAGFR